jgi:hypothetical protein
VDGGDRLRAHGFMSIPKVSARAPAAEAAGALCVGRQQADGRQGPGGRSRGASPVPSRGSALSSSSRPVEPCVSRRRRHRPSNSREQMIILLAG